MLQGHSRLFVAFETKRHLHIKSENTDKFEVLSGYVTKKEAEIEMYY